MHLMDPMIATGRSDSLFAADWRARSGDMHSLIKGASVLVLGGAGTIGAACVGALLEFSPRRLHVIDIDENGLARLARDIRSSAAAVTETDLHFLAADMGAYPALAHIEMNAPFDLALDFAAIKHVRSEKSVPALLHMIDTNVLKQDRLLRAIEKIDAATRCFAVSTDKAADPANFMGATKRLLEEVLFAAGDRAPRISTASARFANVAFSSGSLLESFWIRLQAGRPLAAPRETKRYFLSAREAAEICLLALIACPRDALVAPRLAAADDLVELADVAAAFLARAGFKPIFVDTLDEAERHLKTRPAPGEGYPVVLTPRDTSGEKPIEVFAGRGEQIAEIGLNALTAVKPARLPSAVMADVLDQLHQRVKGAVATRSIDELAAVIRCGVPNFVHLDGEGRLDNRI